MKVGGARKLDIVLSSAVGLKKVHTTRRMAAYAVAWIEPSVRVPSPMDKSHGCSPVWNATISIALDELTLGRSGKYLHIEILAQGLVSTTPVGFVRVDMTELLLKGSQGAAATAKFHDYPVTRRSGRQQGVINFELCLQAWASPLHKSNVPEPCDPPKIRTRPTPLIVSSTQQRYDREYSSTRTMSASSTRVKTVSQLRPREIIVNLEDHNTGYGDFVRKGSQSRSRLSSEELRQEEFSLLNSYS